MAQQAIETEAEGASQRKEETMTINIQITRQGRDNLRGQIAGHIKNGQEEALRSAGLVFDKPVKVPYTEMKLRRQGDGLIEPITRPAGWVSITHQAPLLEQVAKTAQTELADWLAKGSKSGRGLSPRFLVGFAGLGFVMAEGTIKSGERQTALNRVVPNHEDEHDTQDLAKQTAILRSGQ